MKRHSIVRKLIITFTSITGGVLILVGLIISFLINMSYNRQTIETLNNQLEIVESSIQSYLNQEESGYSELEKMIKMTSLSTNMDAIVVDKLGYVYMVSNEQLNNIKYTKVELDKKIQDEIENVKNRGTVSKVYSKGMLEAYIKPVYTDNEFDGYIIMISNETYAGKHMMLIIWISVIAAMLISGLIVNYFAKRFVVRPLEEINNAARKLAKGEVEKRVIVRSEDEIGQLAESFNSMAEELEAVDKTRKDFISNVSHELRSPITSIKGFVGGILDGVIPRDRENYYLKIVFDEVDRLARLVNDLLDISAMEAGKFNLKKVEFDINAVISLCILNLESKIKNKGLDVKAIFDEKRYFVVGDRDRIIQVATNLLENAIKYSNDDGNVRITTHSKGDKVYVSIFNSGDLIPKEDINNIWDRFYKSDKSRTNKISTGLGLPVVRLILSQHNEDVWVKNIDNKGVEFTFSLSKSGKYHSFALEGRKMSRNKEELRNTLEDKEFNRKYKISIEEKNTKANIRLGTKLLIYLIIAGISGAFFSNTLIKMRYMGVIQQFEQSILNNDMVISDYTKIIDIVSPSIVSISDKEQNLLAKENWKNNWTGIILDETGNILTNYSAVNNLSEVYVRINTDEDNPIKAKVVVRKVEKDLAIIKMQYDGEITPIKFADEESLKIGQEIVVLGSTIYGQSISSVIPGVITSMHDGIGIDGKQTSLMQINAPINQGNTGGPICNSKGELVGLASLELTKINNEPGLYQGIELKELTGIINTTNIFKGILGVSKGGILYDKSKEFKGFYVQEVVKDGNAYKAGIKPTDIILEIDNQKVIAVEDLTLLIQNKEVGDVLHCKVLSDGEIKSIEIKVEERREEL